MRTSAVAIAVLGALSMLSRAAGAVEITVLAGMGAVSGVRDVAPAFEGTTGHKVIVSFEAGPSLMQKVNAGAPADLVAHYPEVIDDLIHREAAQALVEFMSSPEAAPLIRKSGMEPPTALIGSSRAT